MKTKEQLNFEIGHALAERHLIEAEGFVDPTYFREYLRMMEAFSNFFGRATIEEQEMALRHFNEAFKQLNE